MIAGVIHLKLAILNNNYYIINMKPLNLDNRPCSPISSNCVIWQGPDIPCIKLCTGDTVSDIVAKLGTELCTIMEQLDVTNYDLSCFNLAACPPNDFQALIQLLIDKICTANGTTTTTEKSISGCPDCVVSVAECFVQGTATTMQLTDYVQMIANRVCSIVSEIASINSQISVINTTLNDLQTQIDNLPVYTLPSFEVDCVLPPGNQSLDVIVEALMNDGTLGYCRLLDATGTPADINTAVLTQCILDGDQPLAALPAINTMSAYYSGSWVGNATLSSEPSVANAIKNIWVSICDIRAYLVNGFPITEVEAGEGILVTSATVGSTTTYTITNEYLETFVANLTIRNTYAPDSGVIPKVVPSSVAGVQEGQVISKYTSIGVNKNFITATLGSGNYVTNSCIPTISFGTFDNDNGLFTINDPGTYLINARVHLKPDNGSTVFWSGATTYSPTPTVQELRDNFNDIGSFLLGIHPNNNTDVYVAQGQALIPSIDRNVEISVSQVLVANAGATFRVKVLNTTNRDYDGTGYAGADGISFSIVKLKDGLTTTVCP
jgi:hypothetical protein